MAYFEAPENSADAITTLSLHVLKFASFNHLFRLDLLDKQNLANGLYGHNQLSQQRATHVSSSCTTFLYKLCEICCNENNTKHFGTATLAAVIVIGQLCAEEGKLNRSFLIVYAPYEI